VSSSNPGASFQARPILRSEKKKKKKSVDVIYPTVTIVDVIDVVDVKCIRKALVSLYFGFRINGSRTRSGSGEKRSFPDSDQP